MAKYMVRCYYSTMVDVMVEAETREEALDAASGEINKEKYAQELLDNLQECGDNDVELIDHAHEVLGARFPEINEDARDTFACEYWQNCETDEYNCDNFQIWWDEAKEEYEED